jgi:hypothetical protein
MPKLRYPGAMVSLAMTQQVQTALRGVEAKHQVKILYAVESGSRAWGFPSQDSDYDVRFIYIHPPEWYLQIYDGRDVIEQPINELLDVSGWDIRKALKLFCKSNPPLLEWLSSPIIYHQYGDFIGQLRELLPSYYSPRACMYHYLHMANGNNRAYLQGERVNRKKYFYVLRPVLACKWIEEGRGAVPMSFSKKVEELDLPLNLKTAIGDLLERKMAGEELDDGPRIPAISDFLEAELARFRATGLEANNESEVEPLNHLFRHTLRQNW